MFCMYLGFDPNFYYIYIILVTIMYYIGSLNYLRMNYLIYIIFKIPSRHFLISNKLIITLSRYESQRYSHIDLI
jgi:hypothetical protein